MSTALEAMIQRQIIARGIRDPRVIDAIRSFPREWFVPQAERHRSYEDGPLPIGHAQTISQPYIVAYMTEALELTGTERVLEVGTGSGYQTAILSKLASHVWSAELEPELVSRSEALLDQLGIGNVTIRRGDGTSCFREFAPFDTILSAAAPLKVPESLLHQLAGGGRCVIPVGPTEDQRLLLIRNEDGILKQRELCAVRFVPLRSEPSRHSDE